VSNVAHFGLTEMEQSDPEYPVRHAQVSCETQLPEEEQTVVSVKFLPKHVRITLQLIPPKPGIQEQLLLEIHVPFCEHALVL
jgi:hypothetical protein